MQRKISKEGRAAMGSAGAENLERWRSGEQARVSELQSQVDAYRDSLLRDAGANPSATRIGLLEAAVTTYTSILLVRYKLIHSSRSDLATLTERVSWLTSNLTRLLKTLNLDAKKAVPFVPWGPSSKVQPNPLK
jgi:hypothetical protein